MDTVLHDKGLGTDNPHRVSINLNTTPEGKVLLSICEVIGRRDYDTDIHLSREAAKHLAAKLVEWANK